MKVDKQLDRFLLANNLSPDISDPTMLGFSVFFYFDSPDSPLFYEGTDGDSAINYLRNIGEERRANHLKKFKTDFQNMMKTAPEFLQTVSGLGGIHDVPEGTTYWMNEREITFTTLESLGMRVASIFQSYINAMWNERVMVMIPDNLREFSMDIYVHEIRKFKTYLRSIEGDGGFSIKYLDDVMSMFVFKFKNCSFDISQTNPFLELVDNNSAEPVSNQFTITPETLHEAHNLNFSELFQNLNTDTSISASNLTDDITPKKNPRMFGLDDNAEKDGRRAASRLKNTLASVFNSSFSFLENSLQQALTEESVLFSTLDLSNPRGTITFLENMVLGEAKDAIRRGIGSLVETVTGGEEPLRQITDQSQEAQQELGEVPMNRLDSVLQQQLGTIDVPEADFVDVALGNVAGFDQNPISAILDRIAAGSLRNVYQ